MLLISHGFVENMEYLSFISVLKASIISRFGTFVLSLFPPCKKYPERIFSPGRVTTIRFTLDYTRNVYWKVFSRDFCNVYSTFR